MDIVWDSIFLFPNFGEILSSELDVDLIDNLSIILSFAPISISYLLLGSSPNT
jgi:hypothetical protein